MSRWYRRYTGTVSDPKIAEAALVAECSKAVVIATWDMILESAAETNEAGQFRATSRNVAATLGEQIATIERVFSALESLEMIENGIVLAWSKRQFQSDSSTERSRKHRAQKKGNGDATPMQRCATPPDTDSETDTEADIDSSSSQPTEQGAAPAKVGLSEGTELKSAFNGSTAAMLEDIQRWMGPHGTADSAAKWLGTMLTANGQTATAQAYQMLTAGLAQNTPIARPIQYWSKTAANLKANQQSPKPLSKSLTERAAERRAKRQAEETAHG